MHEEGRPSGGGERRRHLLADVAALADAGDDDASARGAQKPQRRPERVAHGPGQRLAQLGEPLALQIERAKCRRNRQAAQAPAALDALEFSHRPAGRRHGSYPPTPPATLRVKSFLQFPAPVQHSAIPPSQPPYPKQTVNRRSLVFRHRLRAFAWRGVLWERLVVSEQRVVWFLLGFAAATGVLLALAPLPAGGQILDPQSRAESRAEPPRRTPPRDDDFGGNHGPSPKRNTL